MEPDRNIWQVVAFLEALPETPPRQVQALAAAAPTPGVTPGAAPAEVSR